MIFLTPRRVVTVGVLLLLPLVFLASVLAGGVPTPPAAATGTTCINGAPPAPADVQAADGLTAEQTATRDGFAAAVATTGLSPEEKDRALLILIAAGLVEGPDLLNPEGGHLDSVGSLQQRDAWGPRAVRMDPHAAALMFLNGGQGGQPGLLDYNGSSPRRPDWRTLDPGAAAQRVQVSAYPLRYAEELPRARAILDGLRGEPTTAQACVTTGPLQAASPDAAVLLANPRVTLSAVPRSELQAGIVDGRLIAALNSLAAAGHTFSVENFKGDRTTTNGSSTKRMSNHFYGRAADLFNVGGVTVRSRQEPVRSFVRDAVAVGVPEIGQPFPDLEALSPGVFANAAHQDHVHLGYWSPTTGRSGP